MTAFSALKEFCDTLHLRDLVLKPWKPVISQTSPLPPPLTHNHHYQDVVSFCSSTTQNSLLQPLGRLGRHYLKSVYDLAHYHKNNTEGHSPWAKVNNINLRLLCSDCFDLWRRSKISKVKKRSTKDGKIQAWKRSENSVTPAVQTSYWCELTLYARHRLSNRPCLIWSYSGRWHQFISLPSLSQSLKSKMAAIKLLTSD